MGQYGGKSWVDCPISISSSLSLTALTPSIYSFLITPRRQRQYRLIVKQQRNWLSVGSLPQYLWIGSSICMRKHCPLKACSTVALLYVRIALVLNQSEDGSWVARGSKDCCYQHWRFEAVFLVHCQNSQQLSFSWQWSSSSSLPYLMGNCFVVLLHK